MDPSLSQSDDSLPVKNNPPAAQRRNAARNALRRRKSCKATTSKSHDVVNDHNVAQGVRASMRNSDKSTSKQEIVSGKELLNEAKQRQYQYMHARKTIVQTQNQGSTSRSQQPNVLQIQINVPETALKRSAKPETSFRFLELPPTLLSVVLSHGRHRDIARWGAVCRQFRAAAAVEARKRLAILDNVEWAHVESTDAEVGRAFCELMSCQYYAIADFGVDDGPIRLEFEPWDSKGSGLYFDNLKLVDLEHDTFGAWFIAPSSTLTLADFEQSIALSTPAKGSSDTSYGDLIARCDLPDYATVAVMLRAGDFVPLSPLLEHTLGQILPRSSYVISRWSGLPLKHTEVHSERVQSLKWKLFGKPKSMDAACAQPQVGGATRNGFGGTGDGYFFEDLSLAVTPLQPSYTLDKSHVAWYAKQFEASKSFEPTILVLLHNFLECTPPVGNMEPKGYLLDGHHKLAAACEVGRSVGIVLFEARTNRFSDPHAFPPLPWSEPSELLVAKHRQFRR